MKLYLVKYGEITLKGKNRRYFENKLLSNIRSRIEPFGAELDFYQGRIFVRSDDDRIIPVLQDTFGLVEICPAVQLPLEMEALREAALEQMAALTAGRQMSFKVETRRSNKGFALDSPAINRDIGGYVLKNLPHVRVDVHEPDIRLEIEVREQIYLYAKTYPAVRGIPYGTAGKSVVLMSGGIDSPVAAFNMARRGVEIVPLHFHAMPFTSEMALDKVRKLVRRLSDYTGWLYFYHLNLSQAQIKLREACDERYFTILQRRLMTRLATLLAEDKHALSLTTGENLAQVASQTMEGIYCTNDATHLPIFRPLISLDKDDIVKQAKQIETFETSILPYEDCCTIFLPAKVATRPKLADVLAEEAKVDMARLIEDTWQTLVREKIEA
ncbi:MAG TPA: tRNA 4-thiouridine(8) synthase ThiI [Tissierellia bacterium]|nr:tRNA 4-thiouridine(8) synthase ThiI [Tissierellia bacterium]